MSSMTIEEAKEIAQQLQILVLKINGTKKEDGTVNTVGLIEQLENLYAKLNPTSIVQLGGLAREVALDSLEKIETKFFEQDEFFEDKFIKLELFFKAQENSLNAKLEKITKTIDAELEAKMTSLIKTTTEPFFTKFSNESQSFLEEMVKISSKASNNYTWMLINLALGLWIGFMIGLWLY